MTPTPAAVPYGASTSSLLDRGIRPDAAYVVASAKHWLNGSPDKHPFGTTVIGWSLGNHVATAIRNVTSQIFPESAFFWLQDTSKAYMDNAVSETVATSLTLLLSRYVPGSLGEGIRFAALPHLANALYNAGKGLLDAPEATEQSLADKAGRVLLGFWALLYGQDLNAFIHARGTVE